MSAFFLSRLKIRTFRSMMLFVLTVLLLLPGAASASAQTAKEESTPSGIALRDLESYVDRFVEPYIGKTTAAASIAVVKNGQIVLSKAYGYANVEDRIAAEPQTVFEFGSISKLFVWTSVMQLVEAGKLDLQTDIRTYLPPNFLKRLTYEEPITLLNLMNHTAGFEEYMFDLAYKSPEQVKTLEEGLRSAEPAQIYRPGEKVAYSNYGNTLAAYIVQKVSGEPYDRYVDEHILAPLHMKDTEITSLLDDRPDLLQRKAIGYSGQEGGTFVKGSWNYMSMYPNGGANGTAADLARFASAFMPASGEDTSLFRDSKTLPEMLSTSRSDDAYMPGNAHGFWEYPGASRTLGHGGNTMAFSSSIQIVPQQRFAVVVLTNEAGEANLVHGLTQALIGSPDIPPSGEVLPDSSQVAGSYLAARRTEKGFMSVYPYLSLMQVSSDSPDTLSVKLVNYRSEYRQIRPYLYQRVSGDAALEAWPLIRFAMKDGQVERISVYTTDYVPLPANRSLPLLTVQAALAAAALAFFVIVPPVKLAVGLTAARFGRKRRLSRAESSALRRQTQAFQFSGTLLALNNLLLAFRMLAQNERPYSDVQPQLILNGVFAAAGLAALILILFSLKRRPRLTRWAKLNLILSVSLWLILIALLIVWQFYR